MRFLCWSGHASGLSGDFTAYSNARPGLSMICEAAHSRRPRLRLKRQQRNGLEENMTDLRQAGAPVPKFRTRRPECRWENASDGALVMVWSLAEVASPVLRVVGGNPNAPRPAAVDTKAAASIRRARLLGERAAIALLLGVGGYLTLISFVSDYATFP
jgi:hypothetical protein